jgi:DHA1 family tetracycline resistance protein-like MFS transporter
LEVIEMAADKAIDKNERIQNHSRIIFCVSIIRFVDAFGVGVLIPLLPMLSMSLGLNMSSATMIASIYPLCLMISGPVMGRMSDKSGRKPVILVGMIASVAGAGIMALHPTLAVLVLSRVLGGIGAANSVAAGAMLSDISDIENRGRYLNIRQISFTAGIICGPLVGALLANADVTYIFSIMLVCGVIALLCAFALPETRHIDHGSANEARDLDEPSFFRGLGVFPLYLLAGCFFVNLSFTIISSSLPLILQELFGGSQGDPVLEWMSTTVSNRGVELAGWLLFTSSIVALFAQILFGGKVAGHVPHSRSLPIILVVWGLALAGAPWLQSISFTAYWISVLVTGATYGLYFPVLATAISLSVGSERQGEAFGLMESIIYLALTVAPLFSGALAAASPSAPYYAAAVAMALGLIVGKLQNQRANLFVEPAPR